MERGDYGDFPQFRSGSRQRDPQDRFSNLSDPGGVIAISRGLSAAIPPDTALRLRPTPEGSQHTEIKETTCP